MSNRIYKESIIYFVGSIIVAVLGFILSLLYSYYFTPNDYGIHSLASSTYMLLSQFCGVWMSTGVLRFNEKYKNNNNGDKLYSSMYITVFAISIMFIILVNLGSLIICKNNLLKIIMFIYSLVYFFEYNVLIFNTSLRCNFEVKKYNYNVMINNFLKIFILLCIIYIFNIKSVIVISLSILLTEMLQYFYFLFKYKLYCYYNFKKLNKKIIKEIFIYAFPLIGTTITGWILNVSDRYVIAILNNSHNVGLYSYAYLLGNNLFWLLSNFIMLGAYPNLVKLFEANKIEELKQLLKKYINLYLMVIIPCCFGVVAVSKTLFLAITSQMYHEAYMVFIYTAIGISTLGLCSFINKIFELYKKTKTILLLNVICAVFNIIFNIILIYYFGYVGGAISTLLSYILYFILAIKISNKYFKIIWDYILIIKYLISGLIMYFTIIIIKSFVNTNLELLNLIIYVAVGFISYLIIMIIIGGINKKQIKEIISLIKKK